MSIQDIEKSILAKAQAEAKKIDQDSADKLALLEKTQAQKLASLKSRRQQEILHQAASLERSILVPARLNAKKSLLQAKQEILSKLYADIQKEKKLSLPEITQLREETEIKASQIIFGEQ